MWPGFSRQCLTGMAWVHQMAVQLFWPELVRQGSTSVALVDTGPGWLKMCLFPRQRAGKVAALLPRSQGLVVGVRGSQNKLLWLLPICPPDLWVSIARQKGRKRGEGQGGKVGQRSEEGKAGLWDFVVKVWDRGGSWWHGVTWVLQQPGSLPSSCLSYLSVYLSIYLVWW